MMQNKLYLKDLFIILIVFNKDLLKIFYQIKKL